VSESRLFDIPQQWRWAPLGEIAEVKLGKMLSAKAFESDLIQLPYLRNQNVRWGTIDYSDIKSMGFKKSELQRYGLKPGDLLVCEGGEPGRCAVYTRGEGEFMYQKALHRIRPYGGLILPKYLQFCLWNYVANGLVIPRPSQTTIQHLPLERMLELPIPIAPLREQERIVEELEKQFTRLDAAERNLLRTQSNLRRYRASVLKAACEGRIVPTEAELARVKGRGDETAQHYVRQKESSDQGTDFPSLPEGWHWAHLSHIGQVTGGLTKNPARSGYILKLPYLRVANVYAGRLELDDVQQIGIQETEVKRGLLQKDDLLVVEGNGSIDQIGRVAIWDGSISPCVHQNHIIKVRFPDADLARYALLWLLSPEGRSQIVRVASSTTGLHTLSISKVGNLPIPLPPPEELPRIIAETERRISLIERLEQTCAEDLARAQTLHQAILRQAFSGKLVLQDPDDEPATVLLERIREARIPSNRTVGGAMNCPPASRGTSQSQSGRRIAPPAAATEPDSGKPLFIEQDPSSQMELSREILFAGGIFGKEDAVREIAQGLKDKGLAHFQRLRKDGPLFNEISSTLDRGVRQGFFDRPKRGHVRAILPDPKAYSLEHWRLCLTGSLDGEAVEEEDALRAAAEWARENMGLEFARLREDGVILTGLRAALKEAVKRGEITRRRNKVSRSTT
jgi:type I restriction enzyme, S subunit